MSNILVLGNGFDLYHGLQTRYYDFIQFAKNCPDNNAPEEIKNICEQNTFLRYFIDMCEADCTWIDCEEEIKNVVLVLQKVINSKNNGIKSVIDLRDMLSYDGDNTILSYLKKYIFIMQQIYATVVGKYYKDNMFNKPKLLEDVRTELDELIRVLEYYLEKETSGKNKRKRSKQIQGIKFDKVINFNYTDTYSKIYSSQTKVLYPHGRLKDSKSMVLGIMDDKEVSLDFIYFKKYFQRIQKRTVNLKKEILNSTTMDKTTTIYFFGMSMGKSDEDLIKQIISVADRIEIFYYNQQDYERKIINLIDIYGREEIEKWLEEDQLIFNELQ